MYVNTVFKKQQPETIYKKPNQATGMIIAATITTTKTAISTIETSPITTKQQNQGSCAKFAWIY